MRVANTILAGIIMISLIGSGCATELVQGGFGGRPLFSTFPQIKDYTEVGPVSARKYGFIWDKCELLANKAMDAVLDSAKREGANAVVNVKQDCTTAYGWFLLYVVPGLGPWVKFVDVSGVAIKRAE